MCIYNECVCVCVYMKKCFPCECVCGISHCVYVLCASLCLPARLSILVSIYVIILGIILFLFVH